MHKNHLHFSGNASHGRGDQVSVNSNSRADAVQAELIKLGVDTHGGQYTFARMIDHQGVQPAQKLSPAAFMAFLQKQKLLARRVVMVYEAGPYGFALHRQAVAMGVESLVCAPERMSRGRKQVNDNIDARELLSRLDRHLAGNTTALRLVAVPTLQHELARRLARQRNTFRKENQRWKARGRSLLHTMGIHRPGRWWEPLVLQSLLEQIQQQYGKQARDQVSAELQQDLEMMQTMGQKLDELTKQLRQSAREKRAEAQKIAEADNSVVNNNAAANNNAAVKQTARDSSGKHSCGKSSKKGCSSSVMRIKGIGDLSDELLDLEMGDWQRFGNRRQVASYTGLCPGEDSSGDSRMMLSIDKHGNPRVRALLVELAWLLPRYQPDYCRLKRWKAVLQSNSAAMRKKAAVALARQLAVDLWRIKTNRITPQKLGLKLVAA
jgi:transposase